MTKPPAEIVELREKGFSDDQILRLVQLKILELRGLVIRETQPDGSAILHYPQPDHPEVKAFLEATSDGICACCGEGPKPSSQSTRLSSEKEQKTMNDEMAKELSWVLVEGPAPGGARISGALAVGGGRR